MKKSLKKIFITIALIATTTNFVLPSTMINAATESIITEVISVQAIIANTYVGDMGVMVDSFEINVDDATKIADLKATDFDITGNYDGYPLNSQGQVVQNNYTDDEIKLTLEGNKIKLSFKAFKYPGGYVSNFGVVCNKYPELSFNQTNVTKVNTKTVDEFENLTFKGSNGVTIPYRLRTVNTGKPEPLVIWMHGSGEVGTDNVKPITANRGAVAYAESGYAANVIAAQYPYKFSVELTDTELNDMKNFFNAYEELINKLVAEGKVDKNKIYVTGASMGGGLTLRFLLEKPNLFAGSVAIASRGTVKDLSELKTISNLPIWLFHAEEDGTNSSTISKNIYNKLQELGNDKTKLTIYSTEYMNSLKLYGGLLHGSWVPTLNNKEMMSWLFSQSRQAVKVQNITANTYVGDMGVMIDSFEIDINDASKIADLQATDFDIIGNYDGYPLNSEGKVSQDNYTNDEIKLTVEENKIKLSFIGFKYPGGYVSNFGVVCNKYPELSFNQTNVTKVNTKTVDEFENLTFKGSNGVTIPYRLKTVNTGKPEPLVIWMHGSGEVGTDNVKPITANRGAVAYAESGYAANVIAAQYPYKFSVELTDTELNDMKNFFNAYEELINKLVAEGKVDKNRIYVTGASMGGGLTLRFLLEKPNLFAGSVAIASRGTVKDLSELKTISSLPIWLFHAEEDGTNSSTISKNIYNKLQELGNDKAKLTIYSTEYMNSLKLYGGLLHGSWVPTLNNKEMMSWLFSQSKEIVDNSNDSSTSSQDIVSNITNKDGVNKITINNPDLKSGVKVEIADVQSVKDGKGSFEIVAGNSIIKLPFSSIDDKLLINGSKIVFDFNVEENADITKNIRGLKKVFVFNLSVVNGDSKTPIHGLDEGQAEITITLTDEEMKELDRNNLSVFYYNESSNKFETLETRIEGNNVIFKTTHFSKFIIAESALDKSTGEAMPKTGDLLGINKILVIMMFAFIGILITKKNKKLTVK